MTCDHQIKEFNSRKKINSPPVRAVKIDNQIFQFYSCFSMNQARLFLFDFLTGINHNYGFSFICSIGLWIIKPF